MIKCHHFRAFSTKNVEYIQERFPYILGNNLNTLVKTRPTTKLTQLQVLESFVNSSKQELNVGFFLAYKCLLESLAADDRDALFDICEGTLYHKFSESLDTVKEKNLKLELLNKH